MLAALEKAQIIQPSHSMEKGLRMPPIQLLEDVLRIQPIHLLDAIEITTNVPYPFTIDQLHQ